MRNVSDNANNITTNGVKIDKTDINSSDSNKNKIVEVLTSI